MYFNSYEELLEFCNKCKYVGMGGQGCCYTDGEFVYKIYYDGEKLNDSVKTRILRFKDLENDTFVFPQKVIIADGEIMGEIARYVPAKNFYNLDPLNINLNFLIEQVKMAITNIFKLSKDGVKCFDVMYNIMLGKQIWIVDSSEYNFSSDDVAAIYRNNIRPLNLEIMYFLVDGIFDKVIKANSELLRMYMSHGENVDIIKFLSLFKIYLSELMGKEIGFLKEALALADKSVDEIKRKDAKYVRLLNLHR